MPFLPSKTTASVPSTVQRTGEGGYSPGPYLLDGGWLSASAGRSLNWWQMGRSLTEGGSPSSMVRACVSCYAQTVAMCPGAHWRATGDGGRERVARSALARFLAAPNPYQTISDFLLNLTSDLYENGNAYALALRNSRFEIAELHLMNPRASRARVAETGEIFYFLGGNEVVERMFGGEVLAAVPARDVLHLRLNTRRHMLKGDPPLTAAMMDIAASNAMVAQALAYTQNEGRPSGVLETDLQLNTAQTEELRRRWNEVTAGANAGGTPILSNGLKWRQVTPNSRDAQVAELLHLSDQRIASVYRVPPPMLSFVSGQTAAASTEALMQFWLAGALGFTLNHIEEGLGRLFRLAGYPAEYLELDTEALLRSAFKDQIAGLAQGVQGGVFAPNEARAKMALPAMPYGDEPRVQQQVVPLSAWAQPQPETPRPDASPSSPPAPSQPDSAEDGEAAAAESALRAYRAGRANVLAV